MDGDFIIRAAVGLAAIYGAVLSTLNFRSLKPSMTVGFR
jgi:hypothetical protein